MSREGSVMLKPIEKHVKLVDEWPWLEDLRKAVERIEESVNADRQAATGERDAEPGGEE